MKLLFFILGFTLLAVACKSQNACEFTFVKDTMTDPRDHKVLDGDFVECTLKKFAVVRVFKSSDNRYFLRFNVTENFYFDKVATLEIRSGNRSYYNKDTKQFKINKTNGLFVIEIFKNYIAQLKDDGITSIVFGEAETDFTRQDAVQIRKLFKCFYETLVVQK